MDPEQDTSTATRVSKQHRNELLGVLFGFLVVLPIACSVLAGISAWWRGLTLQDALYSWIGRPFYSHTGWPELDRMMYWVINKVPLALWLIVILPLIWLLFGLWIGTLIFEFVGVLDREDRHARGRGRANER